ncbi:MAG: methyltransferase domain-containing protein [Thermoleophilia bacterium]|nr:methyltransferase domain-containing protein [Thermoleophilia bacterium]
MSEFTGERVIPGEVDPDLWNEHVSRYLFAGRLCRRKRVLDLGCGAGYGSAELSRSAASVVGLDPSAEALGYAAAHFTFANLMWLRADARQVPLRDNAFDLVVAFEIIEHLADWGALLDEVRRVLVPEGQFIVSTPNKLYYAESRRLSGPNPFHEHEFSFEEFRQELGSRFAHVSLFVQNHGPSITFQPVGPSSGAEVRVDSATADPDASNFFIAVCAAVPQTGSPTFVHVPSAANVLRERDQHILLLEDELRTKNQWLDESREQHHTLVEEFRKLKVELEERNEWAAKLNTELEQARQKVDGLNKELAERAAWAIEVEQEKEANARWGREVRAELDAKIHELAEAVEALHQTEKTVEERTAWAQDLDRQVRDLESKLARMETSRWVRFGRTIRVAPDLRQT